MLGLIVSCLFLSLRNTHFSEALWIHERTRDRRPGLVQGRQLGHSDTPWPWLLGLPHASQDTEAPRWEAPVGDVRAKKPHWLFQLEKEGDTFTEKNTKHDSFGLLLSLSEAERHFCSQWETSLTARPAEAPYEHKVDPRPLGLYQHLHHPSVLTSNSSPTEAVSDNREYILSKVYSAICYTDRMLVLHFGYSERWCRDLQTEATLMKTIQPGNPGNNQTDFVIWLPFYFSVFLLCQK